jgi:hypothetical protein
MAQFVRAFDITIGIRIDGDPKTPLSINSGTWNRGLTTEEVPLVGKPVPAIDGINGIKVLTLDANTGRWIFDLFDAQEAKNSGDTPDTVIEAEFSIDLGGGDIARYLMPDCVAHEPGTTFGGSTERVTESVSLSCDTAIRRS